MSVSIFRPALMLFTTLLFLPLLSGCSDEPEVRKVVDAPLQAFHLNSENHSEFIVLLVNDYLDSNEKLIQHYAEFRKANDVQGFIAYRNESWTPEYMRRKEFYQQMLHRNKAYAYRHQINGLFDRFMGLQKLSLHLKHSLQNSDANLAAQVMEKLTADEKAVTASLSN
ncbi:hypothetical protein [Amphritea sp.]|uniref:hypothetical protein n=1 Tax=Amphritea sp. TaxID=1872502 RepID=UPI0025C40563|nr:hypothetical protein [Amphritea sp.]